MRLTITMDPSGRLRLPARLRKRLGYQGQITFQAELTDRGILLQTQDDAWRAAQGAFAHLGGGRWSDELVSERRAESVREDAE